MAQRTIVLLIDDIDGTELSEGGETVNFSLDGVTYEIDLKPENAAKLRDTLAPFISAARRVAGARSTKKRPLANPDRELASRAREWAKSRGMDVPARGRVPRRIIEAYEEHHSAA